MRAQRAAIDADRHTVQAVTIPFAPRAARAINLTIKERREAPIFQAAMGGGWTGTAPLGSFAAPPALTFWRPV